MRWRLPCYSQPQDGKTRLVAKTFDRRTRVDLAGAFDALQESLHEVKGRTKCTSSTSSSSRKPTSNRGR